MSEGTAAQEACGTENGVRAGDQARVNYRGAWQTGYVVAVEPRRVKCKVMTPHGAQKIKWFKPEDVRP